MLTNMFRGRKKRGGTGDENMAATGLYLPDEKVQGRDYHSREPGRGKG